MMRYNPSDRNASRGFTFFQVFLAVIAVAGGVYFFITKGLCTEIREVKQKAKKLANTVVYIHGKVDDVKGEMFGTDIWGYRIKGQGGSIWVGTMKDKPSKGTSFLLEVEVLADGPAVVKRFNRVGMKPPQEPSEFIPCLWEMSRIITPL